MSRAKIYQNRAKGSGSDDLCSCNQITAYQILKVKLSRFGDYNIPHNKRTLSIGNVLCVNTYRDMDGNVVFNATFNNISHIVALTFIGAGNGGITDLPQVTDKLYHIMCGI